MKHFYRLWQGNLALENAFWNWAVFGGLVVNICSSAIFLFLIMADRPVLAFIIGYGFSVPYNFIVSVAVWRSAGRYAGDRRWADLVRMTTVIGMILLSIT